MIRYPATVKSIKTVKSRDVEEEIIENEDGEVLGRKGSVAKLSQLFKVDSRHKMYRSNSMGKINIKSSNQPAFKNYISYNNERDFEKQEQEQYDSTENQLSVVDLRKLYDKNRSTGGFNAVKSTKCIPNSLANNKTVFKKELESSAYSLVNPSTKIRELTRLEDLNSFRSRNGTLEPKYQNPYLDRIVTHKKDEVQSLNINDILYKSIRNPYKDENFTSENDMSKPFANNENSQFSNNKSNENVEDEYIETWEEIYTVPICTEYENEKPHAFQGTDSKLSTSLRNNTHQGELFPDKESALQHLISLEYSPVKSIDRVDKNSFNFQRKSLGEVLSDYQQKGVIPSPNYNLTDFPIKRSEFFIQNNIDTTSAGRTIDVVPQYSNIFENNANPYQNTFHVAKENPLYMNKCDWQDTIGKNKWKFT